MNRTLVAALFLAACSDAPFQPAPDDVVGRVDLSAEGALVGVTVEPDSGRRLALVSDRLFALDGDGYTALTVQPPGGAFTDVVAMGDGIVALSAQSDGFLFDTATGTFTQHFCYEPGWEEWEEDFQITFALGFDLDDDLLVAQPRTSSFDAPDTATASFVATYEGATGATRDFLALPDASYRAGGMAVVGDEMWLGTSDHLDLYEVGAERPVRFAKLHDAGIDSVEGLAIDDVAGTVLVADIAGEVVEIRRAAIAP